jgi:hypothetical protein
MKMSSGITSFIDPITKFHFGVGAPWVGGMVIIDEVDGTLTNMNMEG